LSNEDNIDLFEKYEKQKFGEILFVRIEYANEINMMRVRKNMKNLNEYLMEKLSIRKKDYYNNNVQK
jgi:hypothetical protein